jgi:hypothetical protein
MRSPTLPRPDFESAVKPDPARPAADAACDVPLGATESLPLVTRLKFVQVGVMEIRRRWLAGQTFGLEELLRHLDEDIDLLARAVEDTD